jgi:hypothetical protein
MIMDQARRRRRGTRRPKVATMIETGTTAKSQGSCRASRQTAARSMPIPLTMPVMRAFRNQDGVMEEKYRLPPTSRHHAPKRKRPDGFSAQVTSRRADVDHRPGVVVFVSADDFAGSDVDVVQTVDPAPGQHGASRRCPWRHIGRPTVSRSARRRGNRRRRDGWASRRRRSDARSEDVGPRQGSIAVGHEGLLVSRILSNPHFNAGGLSSASMTTASRHT